MAQTTTWHPESARPERAAQSFGAGVIHVWQLPRPRAAGRAPLLALLATYLGVSPAAIELATGAHGRPRLAAPDAPLEFNWSHSGDTAFVALARSVPRLGIDVEVPSRQRPVLRLAGRYFDPAEVHLLETTPASVRQALFTRLWTAKEALLKAHGSGLQGGLQNAICTWSNDTLAVTSRGSLLTPVDGWRIRHFNLASGGCMSLVWDGSPALEVAAFRAPA